MSEAPQEPVLQPELYDKLADQLPAPEVVDRVQAPEQSAVQAMIAAEQQVEEPYITPPQGVQPGSAYGRQLRERLNKIREDAAAAPVEQNPEPEPAPWYRRSHRSFTGYGHNPHDIEKGNPPARYSNFK